MNANLEEFKKKTCALIDELQLAAHNALDEAPSIKQMEKITQLHLYTLTIALQTITNGLSIMKDEDMLRIWTPKINN